MKQLSVSALILNALASGPKTSRALCEELDLDLGSISPVVRRLVLDGRAAVVDTIKTVGKNGRNCRGGYVWGLAGKVKPDNETKPGMRPGAGDRRDTCARYTECLNALTRSRRDGLDAHCPKSCTGFVPLSRDRMRADAMVRRERETGSSFV